MSGLSKKSWRSCLPEWFRSWRRQRSLERQIKTLDDEYGPRADAERGDAQQAILAEWSFESSWPSNELAALETNRLMRLAHRWRVDFPDATEANGWVLFDHQTGHAYLQAWERVRLNRQIDAARKDAIKWWIDVLVPVLTLLLGTIGALTGLLAVWNGKSN
jgi:hypothetical protein